MTANFGLRVPQHALATILKRAGRRGFVKLTRGTYRRNDAALASLDIGAVRADVLRQHEALIRKLIDYVAQRAIQWTVEDAEAALLEYVHQRSAPILSAAVDHTLIPTPESPVTDSEFLINSFISHLFTADSEGFAYLETIVKGAMLASVLLLPDVSAVTRRFSRIEVYFDTPFLLPALGYLGSSRAAPCAELIDILYEQNVDLRIFEHTLDEVYGVLNAAARVLRDRTRLRQSFDIAEHFIGAGYTPSDVELIMSQLSQTLRSLHIHVKGRPPHSVALGVDEKALEARLREDAHYRREQALRNDIDSLTAIHRLRRGRALGHIEACEALFVTTNAALARVSARFFRQEYGELTVPLCLLDHDLGTIAWLKQPQRTSDLPRKQIIADCYAAMRPPETLWRSYLQEIDRLVDRGGLEEEDYYLLRFSTEARAVLMDLTRGREEGLSTTTIAEVVRLARAAVRADIEAELRTERERRQASEAAATALAEFRDVSRIEIERELEAEREKRLKAQEQVLSAEAAIDAQTRRIRELAVGFGWWSGTLLLAGWFIGTAVLLTLSAIGTLSERFELRILMSLIFVVVGVMSAVDLAFGSAVRSIRRRVVSRVTAGFDRLLRSTLRLG